MITKNLIQVRDMLAKREVSAVEVTRATLAQIKEKQNLDSYVTVCEKEALAAAAEADKKLAAGESGALLGVPVAIKDNICTNGIRTTCASKFLDNYIPPYDAYVVEKIKAAGGIIVGKTNMDEFAMGSSCEYSAFAPGRNAVDPAKVAGGSSGGSAAAVGSYQCYAALGSDTGGSIRQPAAYNGIVGLKPTYSAVSRYGAVAFASSLDQVGPLARTTADCKVLFDVIKGHDKRDTTSYSGDYDADKGLKSIKGKKIGIAKQFFPESLNSDIREAVQKAVDVYKRLGAELVEVSIDSFDMALACYYILSSAEAASNLARFDGIKYGRRASGASNLIDIYYKSRTEGFGMEVKRRIMLGNFVLSSGYYDAYYLRAQKARTLIKKDLDDALSQCDVILSPTTPNVAFDVGGITDTTTAYLADIFTVPVNIAGNPAISVKCGENAKGMPIGLQLIGGNHKENTLFSFAGAYEEASK